MFEKIKDTLLKEFACSAFKTSEMMANSTCYFWDYQPELPSEVMELSSTEE